MVLDLNSIVTVLVLAFFAGVGWGLGTAVSGGITGMFRRTK